MRLARFACLFLAGACTGPNPAYVSGSDAMSGEVGTADAQIERAGEPADTAQSADVLVEAPSFDQPDSDSAQPDAPVSDLIDLGPTDARPGEPVDTVQAIEAAAPGEVLPDAVTLPSDCGTEVANITGIVQAVGVAVDADGTLYFLNHDTLNSYIGRVLRNTKPELDWLAMTNSPTPRALALDSANQKLYALLIDGAGGLVKFQNIKIAPQGSEPVKTVRGNGVTVGPDGTVYYTQPSDRLVYALSATGSPKPVSADPFGSSTLGQAPSALAFGPSGHLLVGLERGGPIHELTVVGGQEIARAPFGKWTGWANGLTFDRRGRLYIATANENATPSVVRLEPDGQTTTISSGTRFSGLAFGRGPLDCRDLYLAAPSGPLVRIRVDDSF
jgi:hypothetical protein